jgi:hypothetical protein
MRWLDRVPLLGLLLLAVVLGLAPFRPEPHVVQKLRLLADGALQRPVDVFDLLWHGVPFLLVGLKLLRVLFLRAHRT